MGEVEAEVEKWLENFKEETVNYDNSAFFEGRLEDNWTRKNLTDRYGVLDTESLEFADILRILGWKYNLSNYGQYSSLKKTFLLKGEKETVEAFRRAFRKEENSDIIESLKESFGRGVEYGEQDNSSGMTEITFSAYLLFLRQEPIFDQHTKRAMKHIHDKYDLVDYKGATYNSYRKSFYQLLDELGWQQDTEAIHKLDKALFWKGKQLKD